MDQTTLSTMDATSLGSNAAAIGVLVYLLRKSPIWGYIPKSWNYLVPMFFGLCDMLVNFLALGKSPREAVELAIGGTLVAIGGHAWGKDSHLPYGGKKPEQKSNVDITVDE